MSKKGEALETENLKRREQKMAEDLKYLTIKAIGRIHIDFGMLIKGEEEAIKQYEYAVGVYKPFGWGIIFSDILKDEREHLEKLRTCLQSINEVYEKEGHIKSDKEHSSELSATLPLDQSAYSQGLAVAKKLTEIGYVAKYVQVPAQGEVTVQLTNPKLEHSLTEKGLYKEMAYLESSGMVHITPYRIEGEIPHAPPEDLRFRESLLAVQCHHTAHISPNAVHEHFACPHNKLDLILKLAEDAFKHSSNDYTLGSHHSSPKKKFIVRYLDNTGVEHTEEIEDSIAFYQRVRREGLSVISIHQKEVTERMQKRLGKGWREIVEEGKRKPQ
jgi:rubrerythrin